MPKWNKIGAIVTVLTPLRTRWYAKSVASMSELSAPIALSALIYCVQRYFVIIAFTRKGLSLGDILSKWIGFRQRPEERRKDCPLHRTEPLYPLVGPYCRWKVILLEPWRNPPSEKNKKIQ